MKFDNEVINKSLSNGAIITIFNLSLQNNLPIIKGTLNNITGNILLDSGAEANCLSSSFYNNNFSNFKKFIKVTHLKPMLKTANNKILPYRCTLEVPITLKTKNWTDEFHVIDGLQTDVLIGQPTMLNIELDQINSKGYAELQHNGAILRINYEEITNDNDKKQINAVERKETDTNLVNNSYLLHLKEDLILYPHTETLVSVVIGKFKNICETKTVLTSSITEAVEKKQIFTGRGVAKVINRETKVALSNLGETNAQLKRGDVVGICVIMDEDDFIFHKLPAEDNINPQRFIHNILKLNGSDEEQKN